MGKKTHLKQIISVWMSLMVILQLTGCYSTKIITVSDIKASDICDIHSEKTLYTTHSNIVISDSLLSGKLLLGKSNSGTETNTHIYILSNTVITINNDLISLPINRIIKIEHEVYDPVKTKIIAKRNIGIGLSVIGFATFVTGIILYNNLYSEYKEPPSGKVETSGLMIATGIGMTAVGIPLWAKAGHKKKQMEAELEKFNGSASAYGIGLKIRF
jgi:hypothetical protein